MKNTAIVFILCALLLNLISCQPNNNNPAPTPDPLNGKVKRMTYNGTVSVSDYYYNSNGILDSIVNTAGTSGAVNTIVCSFYSSNKVVFKPSPISSSVTDSSIYYVSGNKLDSLVVYRNTGSPKQITTYAYNGSATLLSYTEYLNGYAAGVPPTFTNYTDSNLSSTYYTYNTGPNPFRADSVYYTYSSAINNLRPSAVGLNFNGMASNFGYNFSTNKNFVNKITWNTYAAVGATTVKTTLQTDISHTFDAQNRVITETRTMTVVGSSSSPQILTYTFEYY